MNDESPVREVGSQIRVIVSNCGSVEGSVQEERSQYGYRNAFWSGTGLHRRTVVNQGARGDRVLITSLA